MIKLAGVCATVAKEGTWAQPLLSLCKACNPSLPVTRPHMYLHSNAESIQGDGLAQAPAQDPSRTRRRVTKTQLLHNPSSFLNQSPFITKLIASDQESRATHALHASDALVLQQNSVRGSLYHNLTDSLSDLVVMLRRHNHSLPSIVGQVVLAKVLHMTKDRVYVDAGFHSLSELYRPELGVLQVHTPHPATPLNSRRGTSDIRVGDVIKVKVDALYTPYGDMQLQPAQQDTSLQLHARWTVLAQQAAAKQPVMGRVLNQCRGGYAVGVAGFVGLLPYAKASSVTCQKIGTLESFYIDRMDRERRTLVLSDARLAKSQGRT